MFEYATIATITLCMVVIGFMEGLGIGTTITTLILLPLVSLVESSHDLATRWHTRLIIGPAHSYPHMCIPPFSSPPFPRILPQPLPPAPASRAGVLLACCSFVVQGSLVNPIAAAFLGDGLRSREMRTSEERKVLDLRMQGVVYVVR